MNRIVASLRPVVRREFSQVIQNQCTPLASRWYCVAHTFLDKAIVKERVFEVLSNFDKVDKSKVSEKAHFTDDLGLDSLDVVEVVMAMEEEFALEIPDDEAEKLFCPEHVIDYVASHPQAK